MISHEVSSSYEAHMNSHEISVSHDMRSTAPPPKSPSPFGIRTWVSHYSHECGHTSGCGTKFRKTSCQAASGGRLYSALHVQVRSWTALRKCPMWLCSVDSHNDSHGVAWQSIPTPRGRSGYTGIAGFNVQRVMVTPQNHIRPAPSGFQLRMKNTTKESQGRCTSC